MRLVTLARKLIGVTGLRVERVHFTKAGIAWWPKTQPMKAPRICSLCAVINHLCPRTMIGSWDR